MDLGDAVTTAQPAKLPPDVEAAQPQKPEDAPRVQQPGEHLSTTDFMIMKASSECKHSNISMCR